MCKLYKNYIYKHFEVQLLRNKETKRHEENIIIDSNNACCMYIDNKNDLL